MFNSFGSNDEQQHRHHEMCEESELERSPSITVSYIFFFSFVSEKRWLPVKLIRINIYPIDIDIPEHKRKEKKKKTVNCLKNSSAAAVMTI